jgi:hypothetical protein
LPSIARKVTRQDQLDDFAFVQKDVLFELAVGASMTSAAAGEFVVGSRERWADQPSMMKKTPAQFSATQDTATFRARFGTRNCQLSDLGVFEPADYGRFEGQYGRADGVRVTSVSNSEH